MNDVIVEDIIKRLNYEDITMCRLAIKHVLKSEENYNLEKMYLHTLEKLGG